MTGSRDVFRFSLYGEGNAQTAPEFVHIEPISERSSLYEWTISPHAHPGIFQALLLERGGGLLVTDGAEVSLLPAMLVILPAGCVHAFRFEPDAEGWVLSVAADLFNDPRIAALGAAASHPDGQPRWTALDEGTRTRFGWLLSDLDGSLGDSH